MGEDVEHARARRLAERLEVAPPDVVRVAGAVPDVVAVVVDRVVAQEVDRADDVVPVARLEQVGHAVLATGDEVGLDPEPQVGLLAHELAVGVDVVARRGRASSGWSPDVQRLREAVDVLGDAQLADPALGRRLAVALGVRRR